MSSAICYSPRAGELTALFCYIRQYHCLAAHTNLRLNSNTISFDLLGSRQTAVEQSKLMGRCYQGCQVVPPQCCLPFSSAMCTWPCPALNSTWESSLVKDRQNQLYFPPCTWQNKPMYLPLLVSAALGKSLSDKIQYYTMFLYTVCQAFSPIYLEIKNHNTGLQF